MKRVLLFAGLRENGAPGKYRAGCSRSHEMNIYLKNFHQNMVKITRDGDEHIFENFPSKYG